MTHKMKIKQGSPSELIANIFGIRVKLPLGKLRKDESIKKISEGGIRKFVWQVEILAFCRQDQKH